MHDISKPKPKTKSNNLNTITNPNTIRNRNPNKKKRPRLKPTLNVLNPCDQLITYDHHRKNINGKTKSVNFNSKVPYVINYSHKNPNPYVRNA